jgi:hypothetical protein
MFLFSRKLLSCCPFNLKFKEERRNDDSQMETHSYSSVNYNAKDKLNCKAGEEKKRYLPGLLLL